MNDGIMTNSVMMYLEFIFEIQRERYALGLISNEEYTSYIENLYTDLTVSDEVISLFEN